MQPFALERKEFVGAQDLCSHIWKVADELRRCALIQVMEDKSGAAMAAMGGDMQPDNSNLSLEDALKQRRRVREDLGCPKELSKRGVNTTL